jgi:hypothetical protein
VISSKSRFCSSSIHIFSLQSVVLSWSQIHRGSSHVSLSLPIWIYYRLCVRQGGPITDSRLILKRHFTSFVLVICRSFKPARFSEPSASNPQGRAPIRSSVHFAGATQSNGTETPSISSAFMSTEQVSRLVLEDTEGKVENETAQLAKVGKLHPPPFFV